MKKSIILFLIFISANFAQTIRQDQVRNLKDSLATDNVYKRDSTEIVIKDNVFFQDSIAQGINDFSLVSIPRFGGSLQKNYYSIRETDSTKVPVISIFGDAGGGIQFADSSGNATGDFGSFAGSLYFVNRGGDDIFFFRTANDQTLKLDGTTGDADFESDVNVGDALDVTGISTFDGYITGSSASRGSDSFAGTALTDTVTVSDATVNDFYWITKTGSTGTTDNITVQATATGFVLHRTVGTTSGLAYNWLRIK